VGDERTHPEFGGRCRCGAVVRFGRRHVGTVMMRGDLAQAAEGPRLIAAFTALAGEHHGAVGAGAGAGVLDPIREQIRLAELHDAERVKVSDPRGLVGCQGLLQPGDAFPDVSRRRYASILLYSASGNSEFRRSTSSKDEGPEQRPELRAGRPELRPSRGLEQPRD